MHHPDFIVQTAEPEHMADLWAWFREQGYAAYDAGMTWMRYTVNDCKAPTMALVEGWKVRPPADAEVPEPAFMMTAQPLESSDDASG